MVERKDRQATLVDRPDLSEIFADHIGPFVFDGQTLRIEFRVARVESQQVSSDANVRIYPVCRVVLTPNTVMDLAQRLQGLMEDIKKRNAEQNPPEKKAS